MRRRLTWQRQRGQGMTEYIIIVAVIALLSLTLVTQFGDSIRQLFKASGERIVGDDTTTITPQTTAPVKRTMGPDF